MLEEVKNGLPELLKNHICSLKKASLDSTNRKAMCESNLEVVHFDNIPKEYARGKGWKSVPKSNDALYVDVDGKWFFIEFKNGKSIEHKDIYKKIYDSIIILVDLDIIDLTFLRKNGVYILVYNAEKHPEIQESHSRNCFGEYISERAKTEVRLFGIENLEGYLFHETHTYTEKEFEKNFVEPTEKLEESKI